MHDIKLIIMSSVWRGFHFRAHKILLNIASIYVFSLCTLYGNKMLPKLLSPRLSLETTHDCISNDFYMNCVINTRAIFAVQCHASAQVL